MGWFWGWNGKGIHKHTQSTNGITEQSWVTTSQKVLSKVVLSKDRVKAEKGKEPDQSGQIHKSRQKQIACYLKDAVEQTKIRHNIGNLENRQN